MSSKAVGFSLRSMRISLLAYAISYERYHWAKTYKDKFEACISRYAGILAQNAESTTDSNLVQQGADFCVRASISRIDTLRYDDAGPVSTIDDQASYIQHPPGKRARNKYQSICLQQNPRYRCPTDPMGSRCIFAESVRLSRIGFGGHLQSRWEPWRQQPQRSASMWRYNQSCPSPVYMC
jgi:hypothetical protein